MLPPSFSFRLPMRMYIAPPLSPPNIKRKRPAPIPAKCYNTPLCRIPMRYPNAIRQERLETTNHVTSP